MPGKESRDQLIPIPRGNREVTHLGPASTEAPFIILVNGAFVSPCRLLDFTANIRRFAQDLRSK
jgi:hypothetical protein